MSKKIKMKLSPEKIEKLKPNEVFVFGSNEAGIHGAGAASLALICFGAKMGEGIGHYGQSYAIPTKDDRIKTLNLGKIKKYINDFIDYAKRRKELNFLVTEIGCGLAGYTPVQIAPMFKRVKDEKIENIFLPSRFIKVIKNL